jgi:hypothetical protein
MVALRGAPVRFPGDASRRRGVCRSGGVGDAYVESLTRHVEPRPPLPKRTGPMGHRALVWWVGCAPDMPVLPVMWVCMPHERGSYAGGDGPVGSCRTISPGAVMGHGPGWPPLSRRVPAFGEGERLTPTPAACPRLRPLGRCVHTTERGRAQHRWRVQRVRPFPRRTPSRPAAGLGRPARQRPRRLRRRRALAADPRGLRLGPCRAVRRRLRRLRPRARHRPGAVHPSRGTRPPARGHLPGHHPEPLALLRHGHLGDHAPRTRRSGSFRVFGSPTRSPTTTSAPSTA